MTRGRRAAAIAALAVLAVGAGCTSLGYRPEIPPIEPVPASVFAPPLVTRGAELAALGYCRDCHTAPGGRIFAGGAPIPTPFGTLYSTNITPDVDTGIGAWSEEAFLRSLREGVDREGRQLYPAFPYDHFTLITAEDAQALYAYLMTREPVRAAMPRNELRFPFSLRPTLVVWKMLFLREGPYRPDPAQSAEWNRGAYLVQGLAHCGACHTPRNALGAEEKRHRLAGGEAEGWNAYAIDRTSPASVPWNIDSMFDFLRHGWHADHGVARGPMGPVTTSLASAPEVDVRAMAVYLASQMGEPSQRSASPAGTAADAHAGRVGLQEPGAAVYESACASCHDGTRPLPFGGITLDLSTAVNAPNARNMVNVVLYGLPAKEAEAAPMMPGFVGAIGDEQLAALLHYLRSRFSSAPPWRNVEADIKAARHYISNPEHS